MFAVGGKKRIEAEGTEFAFVRTASGAEDGVELDREKSHASEDWEVPASAKENTLISLPFSFSSMRTLSPAEPNAFSCIMLKRACWACSIVSATITPLPVASPSALITMGDACCLRYFFASV